jgi:hypothetical protein
MTHANAAANPRSPDFFSDLADQVMAKLDIGTGWRMVALIEQVLNETQDNLTQLQTDLKRNEAEIKVREGEATALREVIRALKQHQHRLGPCKSRQDLVNCMIDWATQQLTENQNKRKQLEAQSPKDEQAIRACQWEIETLGQLIRAFEQFRERLDPYESKEDKNWKGLVKDIIRWAKKEVQDNEEKLEKLHAATPKSEQEISACERKIAVSTEPIVALEKYQIDLDACLKAYVRGQDRNPQDFVTLLTRALEENREAAKQVRRVTIPRPKRIFFFKKALTKKVSVRLQAEFVAQSDQLQKTLSELFPNSAVSEALHAYVKARSEVRQTLATGFKQCLGLAPKIWIGMKWPLTFGLVLNEELTELDGLRTQRREEAHGCLDALLCRDDEEAREALKSLLSRLTQYLVEEAKCGEPDSDASAQARRKAVQALEDYLKNPQEDTRRALDANKDVLIEMALEHSFKKVQLNGDGPFNAAAKGELVGLGFSGGGIRSATFNLGVLQGLAKWNVLPCIDYLSTVSGGGYIGSWLLAWLKRDNFPNVVKQLDPDWGKHQRCKVTPQIEFLREYSNYLTPKVGSFSADTWAAVATFFRNLLLNLAILISLFLAALLVPYLMASLGHTGIALGQEYKLFSLVTRGADRAFELYALFIFCLGLTPAILSWVYLTKNLGKIWDGSEPGLATQGDILIATVVPLLGAIWILVTLLSMSQELWSAQALVGLRVVLIVILVVDLILWAFKGKMPGKETSRTVLYLGLGFHWVISLLASWWVLGKAINYWKDGGGLYFKVLIFGVPLCALIVLLAGALQVGLAGLLFRNQLREWTDRLAGWLLIFALLWLALFGIAFYSPLLLMRAGVWVGGSLTLAWFVHTISGVLAGFSAKTGKSQSGGWLERLARTAPPVFVVGLFALLSLGIYKLLPYHISPQKKPNSVALQASWSTESNSGSTSITATGKQAETFKDLAARYWKSLDEAASLHWWTLPHGISVFLRHPLMAIMHRDSLTHRNDADMLFFWGLGPFLLLTLLGFLLSWRVDINDFSMHLFYRNRLVRCYLGASRPPQGSSDPCQRSPNRFTGFDPDDDLHLATLARDPSRWPKANVMKSEKGEYSGPYPILNATLNLTHGKRLAWQERMAESFTFTPLYCGGTQEHVDAYRPTKSYTYPDGGPFLGSAMAICGAAVSPYVGFTLSPAAGFLMTVFNARLGQWMRNPSRGKWDEPGPRWGLRYVFYELLGLMNDEKACIYLSDGGHFENLGMYELVRRRCRLIVACDGSEDRDYKFEDLGKAIRKCRNDFGVDIKINTDNLRPVGGSAENRDDDMKKSKQHCAVGVISYEKVWADAKPGILVYVKASLTGDEPTDVLEYKNSHTDFPHDSTADQWFSESQFESYRKLGEHIIEQCASLDHTLRQRTPVRDLLETDEWGQLRTTEDLNAYLARELGGVYQP